VTERLQHLSENDEGHHQRDHHHGDQHDHQRDHHHAGRSDSNFVRLYTRWSIFERDVLGKVKDPDEVLATIIQRQAEVDDEASETDLVADHFRTELRQAGKDPEKCCVFWPTAQVAVWVTNAIGQKIAINKVTPYLKALQIAELSYLRLNGGPGWVWRGVKADRNEPATYFKSPRCLPPAD
jgi:hypothetical protein